MTLYQSQPPAFKIKNLIHLVTGPIHLSSFFDSPKFRQQFYLFGLTSQVRICQPNRTRVCLPMSHAGDKWKTMFGPLVGPKLKFLSLFIAWCFYNILDFYQKLKPRGHANAKDLSLNQCNSSYTSHISRPTSSLNTRKIGKPSTKEVDGCTKVSISSGEKIGIDGVYKTTK